MSYFPFMIELNNERCLIAGGGTVAYRKVCSMLEFGAVVTVVSVLPGAFRTGGANVCIG